MVRLPVFLLLLVAAAALPAWAQIQPRSLQTIDDPRGEFSISLRLSGSVEVSFRDIGTLATTRDIGDTVSEVSRSYDDGYVRLDTRRTTDDTNLPDDGRTNNWRYGYASQIVDQDRDGASDSIAFHRYATRSDGAFVDAESTEVPGIDLDYAYSFGRFAGRLRNNSPRGTWGGVVGLSITSVNAKTDGSINTTLLTDEDRYSLDGAPPPPPPYTAPSSGADSSDTTTLLANRPYQRLSLVEPGGAQVDGFWQVRGGAVSARAGLWARFRPTERLGLRVSAGLSATYLGLEMRYDEWLVRDDLSSQLRYSNQTSPEKWTYFGAYGAADLEYWMTGSTALFIGATYESVDEDISIPLDGRTADIRLGSGTGFRIGITKLF